MPDIQNPDTVLKTDNIHQYYGGSHTLRGVSLTLEEGRVFCLLGRNGVGKTTFLKCLMGLLPARTGSVVLDGRDITRLSPENRARLGLAYVPQGREIFPRLTVEENLRMGLASGLNKDGIPDEVFEMFPVLKSMKNRAGGDLSGGQQQQLAIGRALVMRPRVLILDEPTEGIQPSIIKDIGAAIRTLAKSGKMAILLVEQYYDFAESLADSYAIMSRGELVRAGTGESMKEDNVRALVAI